MTSKRTELHRPIHPFLIALLAPGLILSQNSLEVAPAEVLRTVAFSLLLTGILLWFLHRSLPDPHAASIVVTLLLGHFYLYGRLYTGNVHGLLRGMITWAGLPGQHARVLLTCAVLLAAAVGASLRLKPYHGTMSLGLNIMGLSLLVGTAAGVARTEWALAREPSVQAHPPHSLALPTKDAPAPDIYYLVLDGYGRDDVLEDLYGYDNAAFIAFLEENGFHIAREGHSNYMQTSLSLASTLNLDYLSELGLAEGSPANPRMEAARLVRHSSVQSYLERLGYTFLQLESGYRPSRMDAHRTFGPNSAHTNLFERLMIENSLLSVASLVSWAPNDLVHPGYELHRDRIRYAFSELPYVAERAETPVFVYAHILAPHPPFVFTHDGETRQPGYPYVLLDGSAYPGDLAGYRLQYRDQLSFVNARLEAAIRELLDGPGSEAIVLLQGDHGPGSKLDWESLEETDRRERFGILLAYRLPGVGTQPQLRSPVNLFRTVLSRQFDVDLPRLPDEAYYSTWRRPLHLEPVPPAALRRPSH